MGGSNRVTSDQYQVSFGDNGNIPELEQGMLAQLCESIFKNIELYTLNG